MMPYANSNNAQKMKFPIKDFFSNCDQIRRFLKNFIFCAVKVVGT